MGKLTIMGVTGLVALALAAGVAWRLDPANGDLSETAGATYQGDSVRSFRNLGELVATSRFVLYGRVVDVEQGEPERLADGSGAEQVTRYLVVEVDEQLFSREAGARLPSRIRVSDGYWEGGRGYASASRPWAQPGDEGYLLVTRGRDPRGELVSTYDVLDDAGRVLVDGDHIEFAGEGEGPWDRIDPGTPAEVRAALDEAVRAARSGAAQPVLVSVCHPSVPGDENSEPVCVKE